MIILHITDLVKSEGNGVAVAVSAYANAEKKYCNVAIYNLDDIVYCDSVPSFSFNEYNNIESLPSPYDKPDIVVFNEVYKPYYIKLYKECLKRSIKYLIIPHGCLINESQKRKKIKKTIGNLLLFNRFISKASAIQFLNENEKNNSNFKYKKSIISGNGIEAPSSIHQDRTKNNLIFIGRYNIMIKGLDLLCDICEAYHSWFIDNKVKIILYGRDTQNNLSVLKEMVEKKEIKDVLIIKDAIYGEEKKKVLESAYGFIQLSRHEGQPMGIIEALAYGLPCIVTYGTSFGNYVNEKKCGFGCKFDKKEVFESIKKLFSDKEIRKKLSTNAHNQAKNDFNWDIITKKLIKEYKEV